MAVEAELNSPTEGSAIFLDVETASRIGGALARRRPLPSSYRPGALEDEISRVSIVAQHRVAQESGLNPPGDPRARVVDRSEWVAANVASIDRLVGPALAQVDARRTHRLPSQIERLGRQSSAAQLGSVLAWMSSRVLGQYDILVGEESSVDEDVISYVGPNIVALEQRHGFDQSQFRLWLALHETAHRAQFTGAAWVRPYFLGLISSAVSMVTTDTAALVAGLARAVKEMSRGENPMAEVGAAGLFASEAQREALRRLAALMSVLEGHGEVIMDVAAQDLVPDAQRFHAVLRQRRKQLGAPARLLNQIIGMEAKLRQYEEGERFVRALREAGGPTLVASLFDGPENLPTMEELVDPPLWLARASS
jgi:coenzyme F420 biosynthesis associated uncharacterized protein